MKFSLSAFAALTVLALALMIARIPMCAPAHAADHPPTDSIYQLTLPLTTQDGKTTGLDLYRGHPTMISMFYSSCPYVCPTLISSIQRVEGKLDEDSRARLRVLLVSLDPDNDTPFALNEVAQRHHVDLARWSFTRTPEAQVRKLAAVLGIQYRKLPDGGFNHAAVMILLDAEGRIVTRSSRITGIDEDFLKQLRTAVR